MIERIIATRPDGGVSVIVPSERCFRCCVGAGSPETWRQSRAWRRRQVENFVKPGINRQTKRQIPGIPRAIAERWVEAMAFGGLAPADYFALLGRKDAGPGATAIQLATVFDLPGDRWFRDAWRRSRDGGPIFGHIAAARGCHLRNLDDLVARWNQLERDRDAAARLQGRPTNGPALIDWTIERPRTIAALAVADGWQAIRAIWPEGLPPANAVRGLQFDHEQLEAAMIDDGSSLTDAGVDDYMLNPDTMGAIEHESHRPH